MSTEHPITPPPELLDQWRLDFYELGKWRAIAIHAAQWGADQELEACLRHLDAKGHHPTVLDALRADRRPQPPSLKEQSLAKLPEHPENMASYLTLTPGSVATIRRALEALDD